jgi:8-oxo-dGTP pyrophosphatase MutT (NUDIX family)
MSAEPTESPASTARHAASLIVWRRDAGDVAMLMGMRGAGHRFMPNKLVFPGGAVDEADKIAACATPLPAPTLAALERSADPHTRTRMSSPESTLCSAK